MPFAAGPTPMSFVFERALVQHILFGAQESPEQTRHGIICGESFSNGRVIWATEGDLNTLLVAHPDALATLVTHPDTPPVPTAEEAAAPRPKSGLLLVASLQTKGVLEMRAFDAQADDANGLPITLF